MELLEGRTLREILVREAPLETARATSIMLQTSAAVAAAHQAGIIHRDLKPSNILVTQSADAPAVVKVLDFGIAKLAADILDGDEDASATTLPGTPIGTPRYMAPEQYEGRDLTAAADVYSLGVILYEMLTGMAPFSGVSTPSRSRSSTRARRRAATHGCRGDPGRRRTGHSACTRETTRSTSGRRG